MEKKKVILWIFVGVPLVCVTALLIFVGYLENQPKIQTALGHRLYKKVNIPPPSGGSKNQRNTEILSAQARQGHLFCHGKGVPKNYEQAVEWLNKAAYQQNAWAQNTLGWCYYKGLGVPTRTRRGRISLFFQWLEKRRTCVPLASLSIQNIWAQQALRPHHM